MKRKSFLILFLICFICPGWLLAGCSSQTPTQTQKDVTSFKGGPMPPEARQKMIQAMQNARQKASPQ